MNRKARMALAVVLASTPPRDALAQLGGGLGGAVGADYRAKLSLDYRFYPAAPTSQARDLGAIDTRGAVIAPYRISESVLGAALVSVDRHRLTAPALLPDGNGALPSDLYDVRLGLGHALKLDGGGRVGLNATASSPSDSPFDSYDEVALNAVATLKLSEQRADGWLFFLAFSNNRDFLNYVPIPGVAYAFFPSPKLFALVGLPFFFVKGQVAPGLLLDLSYAPITNARARVDYLIAPPLAVFASWVWHNDRYLLANRADASEGLFRYEMRATAGTKLFLGRHTFFEAAAGYTFNRYYFQGRDFFDREDAQLDIDPSVFSELALGIAF